jgi:transcriptional regulator with XRE-family HTH domain
MPMGVRLNPRRLRRELAIRGLQSADLALLSGLSAATISAAMQGRSVSARILRRIALALSEVPILPGGEELLDLAG